MTLLAWRNVWRNPRRSLITLSSIAFGLAAILFGQSLIETIQSQLIDKATGVFTGHMQVQAEGVLDHKFPDRYLKEPAGVERALAGVGGVAAYARRIHVTGLVASETESAGVLLCGVEPEKETRITSMAAYRTAGRYLGRKPGVYIGERLAEDLDARVGGDLVVLASSKDGSLGAERLPVSGLFKTGSETFDAQIVYLPVGVLQTLLGREGEINELALRLKDPALMGRVQSDLEVKLKGTGGRALTWEEIDKELVSIRRYQNALLGIVLSVVFVIVALGIANSLLMSTFERVREFGVLRALGGGPGLLLRMVLLESVLLGLTGAALGLALGSGLILHYGRAGLSLPLDSAVGYFMPFDSVLYLRFSWDRHAWALATVLATSVLSGVPAAMRAARLKPAQALRSL